MVISRLRTSRLLRISRIMCLIGYDPCQTIGREVTDQCVVHLIGKLVGFRRGHLQLVGGEK